MADGLLSGFRALDLADEKGFVCGKILATLGVDVIKVEKLKGDPARLLPPFDQNGTYPEQSLYWSSFNTDKRSITLNLETGQGQDLFRRLAEKIDFVIESFHPGYLESLGIGYKELSRLNPGIILTSITNFGQTGPYSDYKSCNLVACAMSGIMDSTGYPDQPPVREALDSVNFETGASAALGTVMAHYYRETTGEGQQIDISLQECAASRDTSNVVIWQFDKRLMKRTGTKSLVGGRRPSRWLWSCKDGHLFWALRGGAMGTRTNQAVSQWLDEEGMENPFTRGAKPGGLDMAGMSEETMDSFEAIIGKLFLKHTKKEIMEKAVKTDMQAWILSTPLDVLENPQPKARNFWVELGYPKSENTLAYPGHFFLSNQTENYVRCRAPLVGEHNEEIYGKELGLSEAEITALKEASVI